MLVLTRRLNERIFLDGGITIEVMQIERGQVRIGITAPDDVHILREELLRGDRPPDGGGPRENPAA